MSMSDKDRNLKSDPGIEVGVGVGEFDRVTTEDYATDSFQNLLFSIARFKE